MGGVTSEQQSQLQQIKYPQPFGCKTEKEFVGAVQRSWLNLKRSFKQQEYDRRKVEEKQK
jgi:hypothetical protein